jgi:heat shock protein HslJ
VLVLALTIAACSDDGSGGARGPRQSPVTGVLWVLDTGALVRGAAAITVTARFADGQITGGSGCNTYGAPYEASPRKGTMTIGPDVRVTLIGCSGAAADVEEAYLALLPKVARYQATPESLVLLDTDGIRLLSYRATDGAEAFRGGSRPGGLG